jgi:hypothetical protein
VTVNANAAVFQLDSGFPARSMTYIFKGQLLSKANTFAFYGMVSKSAIVCMDERVPGDLKNNWMKVTRDDGFLARVQYIMDTDYRREVLKHLDVSIKKMELKPKLYRRGIRSFLERSRNGGLDIPSCTAIIPEPAENVSEEPLPFIWEPLTKRVL